MLTLDVRVNGTRVAELRILQVAQHEGDLRDYAVVGMRAEMGTNELVVTEEVVIERHDRSRPVWDLIEKACALAK